MASLSDLLKLPTRDELLTKFVALLRMVGFPVASWHPFGEMRSSAEGEATLVEDLAAMIFKIAKGGYLKLAAEAGDGWVDLIAENFFDDARKPAVATEGTFRFADTGSVGPVDLTELDFWIVDTATRSIRYVVTENKTIPLDGFVDCAVRAESAGASFNLPSSEPLELVTSIPGIAVTNPADPVTGTWITVQGADAETNEELVARLIAKWATLGSGSNEDAYLYHTLSASPEIKRAKVTEPADGTVIVRYAGANGPVSAAASTAVDTVIEAKRPLGIRVTKTPSTANVQSVEGTLYVLSDYSATAVLAAAKAAVAAYARTTEIGGTALVEAIDEAMMNPEGAHNWVRTAPAVDVVLGANEIVVFTFTVATVAVAP